jgi:subtilisin family serine protease
VRTTGRFIVIFKGASGGGDAASIRSTLNRVAGLRDVVTSSDFESGAVAAAELGAGRTVHLRRLGVVIVSEAEAARALSASASADADSPILAIEPEYVAYTTALPSGEALEYLRGYRDAVNHLYDQLGGPGATAGEAGRAREAFADTDRLTWGLQATRVDRSRRTGRGVKVAVLDTGIDLQHPDFAGRGLETRAFTPFPVQDVHGHGTHCVGTACGPRQPASGVRRYGVAFDAQVFVGKVFNEDPEPGAATGDVVAGIEWAVTSGCQVVSISIGIPVNQAVKQYETPIRRALAAGTLVVAAAGNNADRPAEVGFVEPPGNAEASMAVAALDNRLRVAPFSARSSLVNGDGGKVNIAGPGVAVFSSITPSRGTHAWLDGTSMAAPHVAGIAALWAEATGDAGPALWNRLTQTARPLNLDVSDVGAGLVQAPD